MRNTPSSRSLDRSFTVLGLFSRAWRSYARNARPLILLALLVTGVNAAAVVASASATSVAWRVGVSTVSFVVGVALAMALIRLSLAVVYGREINARELFRTEGLGRYLVATVAAAVGIFAGFLVFVIPGILLAVSWQFFGYVIVEDPTMHPIDAIRRSAAITRGYRIRLVILGFWLVVLNFIGMAALFVGFIVTYGLTVLVAAYAYAALIGGEQASTSGAH